MMCEPRPAAHDGIDDHTAYGLEVTAQSPLLSLQLYNRGPSVCMITVSKHRRFQKESQTCIKKPEGNSGRLGTGTPTAPFLFYRSEKRQPRADVNHNQCSRPRFLRQHGPLTRGFQKHHQNSLSLLLLRQAGTMTELLSLVHMAKLAPPFRRTVCRFMSIDFLSARGFWYWKDHGDSLLLRQPLATSLELSSQLPKTCPELFFLVPQTGWWRTLSRIASTGDPTRSPGGSGWRAASTTGAATSGTCVANSTSTGLFRCYRWLFDHRPHGDIVPQHWRNTNLRWSSLTSIQAESETTTFQSRPALCWLAHQVASTIAASAQCQSCCALGALFEKQHTLAKQRDSLSHRPDRPASCLKCSCHDC